MPCSVAGLALQLRSIRWVVVVVQLSLLNGLRLSHHLREETHAAPAIPAGGPSFEQELESLTGDEIFWGESPSQLFDLERYVTKDEKFRLPFETHQVVSDGYHLTIHRLPRQDGKPVFLLHGIEDASPTWFSSGRKALAPLLYDNGFDVWMGNMRGNQYSQQHDTLETSDPSFWNFTCIDIGEVDVPATVAYILNVTNRSSLSMVGHSLGTSTLAAALAGRRSGEYLRPRVNLCVLLSPIITTKDTRGLLTWYGLPRFSRYLETLPYKNLNARRPKGTMLWRQVKRLAYSAAMSVGPLKHMRDRLKHDLTDFVFRLTWGNSTLDAQQALDYTKNYLPAGASTKVFLHAAQQLRWSNGTFRKWDYQPEGNMLHYGQTTPPLVALSNVTVPMALFFAGNKDPVVGSLKNMDICREAFPKVVFHKIYANYSHYTFQIVDIERDSDYFAFDLLKLLTNHST
eukprot:gnl/TRDRNA2_/TRDRNA2_29974_c0_seq1.p1 gnl/TRDRNA2_/TRDRNA2_29974_c0~~gnl/TRDRNA2_/TRDRNA2_29974_c0_seq1.p1  ORF type:complete len:457 (+),score=41.75 gnl/TRDRNA2_/TRDRNA2_29974_c0_seq1:58-1428(+)